MNDNISSLIIAVISGLIILKIQGNSREFTEPKDNQGLLTDPQEVIGFAIQNRLAYPRLSEIPLSVIVAMVEVESNFNPMAAGLNGERGLMQITYPDTWNDTIDRFGLPEDLDMPMNPRENLLVGTAYLWLVRQQLIRHGIPANDWPTFAEAYNVGAAGYLQGRRSRFHRSKFEKVWPKYQEILGE